MPGRSRRRRIVGIILPPVAHPALREYLQSLPTSFVLPAEAVDRLRATAAQLLRESPAFRKLVAELSQAK